MFGTPNKHLGLSSVEKYDGQSSRGGWIELLTPSKLGKYEWVFLLIYDYNVQNTQNNSLNAHPTC